MNAQRFNAFFKTLSLRGNDKSLGARTVLPEAGSGNARRLNSSEETIRKVGKSFLCTVPWKHYLDLLARGADRSSPFRRNLLRNRERREFFRVSLQAPELLYALVYQVCVNRGL